MRLRYRSEHQTDSCFVVPHCHLTKKHVQSPSLICLSMLKTKINRACFHSNHLYSNEFFNWCSSMLDAKQQWFELCAQALRLNYGISYYDNTTPSQSILIQVFSSRNVPCQLQLLCQSFGFSISQLWFTAFFTLLNYTVDIIIHYTLYIVHHNSYNLHHSSHIMQDHWCPKYIRKLNIYYNKNCNRSRLTLVRLAYHATINILYIPN